MPGRQRLGIGAAVELDEGAGALDTVTLPIPILGDNSVVRMDVGVTDVTAMTVRNTSSAALAASDSVSAAGEPSRSGAAAGTARGAWGSAGRYFATPGSRKPTSTARDSAH